MILHVVSSLNSKPVRLPTNLWPCGATRITPPLRGTVSSLSPLLIPATSRVLLSRTTLYLSSNATSPKLHLVQVFAVPHIKHISHHAQEESKSLETKSSVRQCGKDWAPGVVFEPTRPRGPTAVLAQTFRRSRGLRSKYPRGLCRLT